MYAQRFFRVLFLCCAVGAGGFACSASEPKIGATEQATVRAEEPGIVCRSVDKNGMDALRSGAGTLAVKVKSYSAGNSPTHEFRVSFYNYDSGDKQKARIFGLFPGASFTEDSQKGQGFQIPVPKNIDKFIYAEHLCLEVAFAAQENTAHTASAKVEFELTK